jgi:hypothetical protein
MLRTTRTPAISAHISNPHAVLRLREREPAQSKRISNVGRNCQRPDDFEQQKRFYSSTEQNGVVYPQQAERGHMARKPITREVLLGAILDRRVRSFQDSPTRRSGRLGGTALGWPGFRERAPKLAANDLAQRGEFEQNTRTVQIVSANLSSPADRAETGCARRAALSPCRLP